MNVSNKKTNMSELMSLEQALMHQPSNHNSSHYSNTVVYVGREEEGIIGAIAISDSLRHDALSTINRYYPLSFKSCAEIHELLTSMEHCTYSAGVGL